MSVQTEIAQDAVFRSYFMDRQQNVVEQKAPCFNFFWQNTKTLNVSQKGNEQALTNDVQLPIRAGVGSFEYPAGVAFERDRFKAFPVEVVSSYEIDTPTYDDYRAGKKEVLVSLEQDINLMQKEFFKFQDILLAGDGSGVVGTIGTGSTDTILVLDTTANGVHAKAFGVDILKKVVTYDIYNGSTLFVAGVVFASFDRTANTGTLTAAIGAGAPAAGYKIYPASSRNLFPRGLRYGVQGSKDYWQGMTATNKPELNSMVLDAQGEIINNLHIERMLQKNAFRDGEGINKAFKFWCSPSLKSLYKMPGWNMVRYQSGGNGQTLNTSFKDVQYEDSIFKEWRNMDPDCIIGIDPGNVTKIVQKPIGLYDYNGRVWTQAYGSNGRGEGRMYAQFGGRYNWYYENPQDALIAYNFDLTGAVTRSNYFATT